MAQQPDQRSNNNKNRNGGGGGNNNGGGNGTDPNFNWRGLILFALAIFLIGVFYVMNGKVAGVKDIPQTKFFDLLEKNQIIGNDLTKPVELVRDPGAASEYLTGWYKPS